MHIRRAVAEDATALSALALRAKAYWGYAEAQVEAWRVSLEVSAESVSVHPTFVAELDGDVVGFYSLTPSASSWELDNLWVAPEHMRRGFGRLLVLHALQTAAEGGAPSVVVDADPNAEPFYVACGATRTGEIAAPIAGQPDRVRPQLTFGSTRSNISLEDRRAVKPRATQLRR
jgi:molybdenum cofactor cytidylyltransferase